MIKKIIIKEKLTPQMKETFKSIQKDHYEKIQGIYELYDELYSRGKCESYSLDRVYYVAYTLAEKGIKFDVVV